MPAPEPLYTPTVTTQPPSTAAVADEAAPARNEPAGGRRRTNPYLVVLVAVLLVTVAVWLAGGFEKRTDWVTPVTPGTKLVTGPYEIVLTEATARRTTGLDDQRIWQVTALGTALVVGEESLSLPATEAFAAKNPATGAVVDRYFVREGTDEEHRGGHLVPGLPAVPISIEFELPDSEAMPQPVLIAVSELEFSDDSLLKMGEKRWNDSPAGWSYPLPVRRLPDLL